MIRPGPIGARPAPVGCPDEDLPDYVADRLGDAERRRFERHLVACAACRDAVLGERRLRARLASGAPSLPSGLHSHLLALGGPRERGAPALPVAWGAGPSLAVLAPTSPPCHRSALRSAVVAAAAAGASAAAAWTLSVAGGAAPSPVSPSPLPSAPVTTAGTPGPLTPRGTSVMTVRWQFQDRPSLPVSAEARSTP